MKVTITIEDNSNNSANVSMDFDPPLDDSTKMTPASDLAVRILEFCGKEASSVTNLET